MADVTGNNSLTAGAADRLGMTLFIALAVHAIVILGVGFNLSDLANNDAITTMEITLVHNESEDEPEDAEYLAQASQEGGGNVQEKVRDSSPFSNPVPTEESGLAPDSRQALAPPPREQQDTPQEVMSANRAPEKTASERQPQKEPPIPEEVTAAQLYERSQQIARLSAEIDDMKKAYQITPRETYVRGAKAREHRFAAYLDAWRAKVERIGNLNYPEEAVRNNVTGDLLLDVAINPDGSLKSVRVLRSSGHEVLDEAAQNIVRLSAPFPPLTEEILEDTDVLHIPRVWQFKSGSNLGLSR
ncbi:energy transducer TonB [Thiohalophilus sp.]|uniref:energy transducer TonB n=1 Tax=Thiohalophilus sp. TaxID=3028392 RepID=UPI002ACE2DBC|nr:energy transducer TonB [Thiohalophilus sp.]MDZ7804868.1 energy transducer TonB [Thiohalophilus sp.]